MRGEGRWGEGEERGEGGVGMKRRGDEGTRLMSWNDVNTE